MGSRVMHYIVAKQVAKQINPTNLEQFLLGGIAPDAVSTKDDSHFFEGDHADFTRTIAYETFYDAYKHLKQKDYMLGYYVHLVTDELWLSGFYLPWLRNRIENDPITYNRYHMDFALLNGIL